MDQQRLDAIGNRQANWLSAERGSIGERVWGKTLIGEDVPALLAEVERLRAENAQLCETIVRERDANRGICEGIAAQNTRLRAELEAAKRDMQMAGWGNNCEVCAYYDAPYDNPHCKGCDNEPGKSGFKWRGPEEDKQ